MFSGFCTNCWKSWRSDVRLYNSEFSTKCKIRGRMQLVILALFVLDSANYQKEQKKRVFRNLSLQTLIEKMHWEHWEDAINHFHAILTFSDTNCRRNSMKLYKNVWSVNDKQSARQETWKEMSYLELFRGRCDEDNYSAWNANEMSGVTCECSTEKRTRERTRMELIGWGKRHRIWQESNSTEVLGQRLCTASFVKFHEVSAELLLWQENVETLMMPFALKLHFFIAAWIAQVAQLMLFKWAG